MPPLLTIASKKIDLLFVPAVFFAPQRVSKNQDTSNSKYNDPWLVSILPPIVTYLLLLYSLKGFSMKRTFSLLMAII